MLDEEITKLVEGAKAAGSQEMHDGDMTVEPTSRFGEFGITYENQQSTDEGD